VVCSHPLLISNGQPPEEDPCLPRPHHSRMTWAIPMGIVKWTGRRSSTPPTPRRGRGGHALGQSERTGGPRRLGVPWPPVRRGGSHAPCHRLRRHQGGIVRGHQGGGPWRWGRLQRGGRALQALGQEGALPSLIPSRPSRSQRSTATPQPSTPQTPP
jgi:hypothetical protein